MVFGAAQFSSPWRPVCFGSKKWNILAMPGNDPLVSPMASSISDNSGIQTLLTGVGTQESAFASCASGKRCADKTTRFDAREAWLNLHK